MQPAHKKVVNYYGHAIGIFIFLFPDSCPSSALIVVLACVNSHSTIFLQLFFVLGICCHCTLSLVILLFLLNFLFVLLSLLWFLCNYFPAYSLYFGLSFFFVFLLLMCSHSTLGANSHNFFGITFLLDACLLVFCFSFVIHTAIIGVDFSYCLYYTQFFFVQVFLSVALTSYLLYRFSLPLFLLTFHLS